MDGVRSQHQIKAPFDFNRQSYESSSGRSKPVPEAVGDGRQKPVLRENVGMCNQAIRRGHKVSTKGPCVGYRSKQQNLLKPRLTIDEVIDNAESHSQGVGCQSKGIEPAESFFNRIHAPKCLEELKTGEETSAGDGSFDADVDDFLKSGAVAFRARDVNVTPPVTAATMRRRTPSPSPRKGCRNIFRVKTVVSGTRLIADEEAEWGAIGTSVAGKSVSEEISGSSFDGSILVPDTPIPVLNSRPILPPRAKLSFLPNRMSNDLDDSVLTTVEDSFLDLQVETGGSHASDRAENGVSSDSDDDDRTSPVIHHSVHDRSSPAKHVTRRLLPVKVTCDVATIGTQTDDHDADPKGPTAKVRRKITLTPAVEVGAQFILAINEITKDLRGTDSGCHWFLKDPPAPTDPRQREPERFDWLYVPSWAPAGSSRWACNSDNLLLTPREVRKNLVAALEGHPEITMPEVLPWLNL